MKRKSVRIRYWPFDSQRIAMSADQERSAVIDGDWSRRTRPESARGEASSFWRGDRHGCEETG